ncbi:hypothetical protein GC163_08385 [bacterium]|nr:hypothetical protein [bacterium]
METVLNIDVAGLDASHRQAIEEVVGHKLATHQRLIITVLDTNSPTEACRPPQTLENWTAVYDGLTDDEITAIDKIARHRANPTRSFPDESPIG